MKLLSLFTISALSLTLLATPNMAQADNAKSESRHVVVGGKSAHQGSKGSSRGHKYHNGKKKHYKHHNHRSRHHKHRHHSLGKVLLGAAIGHSVGIHGSWYNGHPWCPTHLLYHSHTHRYYDNYYYDLPKKLNSYIEQDDEGRCYKVSEFSNGEVRKKRIRNYHCADIDEWDDWDDE